MTETDQPEDVTGNVTYEERIDLRALSRNLWQGKWLLGALATAGLAIAVVIALLLPNIYRAEALLAPSKQQSVGGIASLAGQYAGLASLPGIGLAGATTDDAAFGLETLKSRGFISDFISRHGILVPLMAAKGWDRSTRQLILDANIFDVASDSWVRDASPPREVVPSVQEASERFRDEVLSVSQDKETGFVTIAVEHYSPDIAKQWVDWLVHDINATIMERDVHEAEQAIAYLEEQIAATPLSELQNVFFGLIEEQTKTVMLANVSPEYLFRTIDPAVVPELKTKPRRAWMAFLGLVLGAGLGVITVLVRARMANEYR